MPPTTPRTISLLGKPITYTVRRSARARQVRLRVGAHFGLEVVVPARGRLPDIPLLLRERAAWILRALDRVAAGETAPPGPLLDGAAVPYLGSEQRLRLSPAAGQPPTVVHDDAARTLTVRFNPANATPAAILARWFRDRARERLTARADAFATQLGVRYARLAVRDTRTRWGSCSSQGGLNFSWRLILAPPAVLDYVVIHELAHLRELNHSPRFWAIVAAHCPDHAAHQAWLKQHGARLQTAVGQD